MAGKTPWGTVDRLDGVTRDKMRCGLLAAHSPAARQDAAPPEVARELLNKHCVEDGGAGMQRTGLRPESRGEGDEKGRPGWGGLGGAGRGQPAREPMMETRGMKRAMTMEPTTTARKMMRRGSMMEVMEATALSTSSS